MYRAERTRTTWKLRVGVLVLVLGGLWLTSGWWTVAIGRSLVCESDVAPSEAILVENFDPDYLLFERAAQLRTAGLAARVLVPIRTADKGAEGLSDVALGIARVMASIARVGPYDVVPVNEAEPITLHVARDVQRYLEGKQIRSVIVVTSLLRSRRTELVYDATLGRAGITVRYSPVRGTVDTDNWTSTWHGVQRVAEQWLKLQYYRLYVLPFRAGDNRPPAGTDPG